MLNNHLIGIDRFPRSSAYDSQWVLDNQMGPNVLWLAEALSQCIPLEPNMRILDLGCGRALGSIFLAREFDLQVWATDFLVPPGDNWARIRAAEAADRVFPICGEAHNLPFADMFFDAVVSMNAYHYFGTDDRYLGYLVPFLKPGGRIGIVVPGLQEEFGGHLPDHLRAWWKWDYCTFHSPGWWRQHWEKTGKVVVETADSIPDGWRYLLKWYSTKPITSCSKQWIDVLGADAGRNLNLTRLVARKPAGELP